MPTWPAGDRAPCSRARPSLVDRDARLAIFIVGMPHVMPLVYLLVGYWLPALIVTGRRTCRFEQRLLDFDRRLFGADGLDALRASARHGRVIEYLELAYLLCYAVVPAGYACLLLAGSRRRRHRSILVDRAAGLVPLLRTAALDTDARAPSHRAGSRDAARSSIRQVNLAVLNRASVQWNTFPSGHTAASIATALAVAGDMPLAGLVLAVVAVSIAAGSVVGRYHYAADAIAGALVAMLAFVMASAVRGL